MKKDIKRYFEVPFELQNKWEFDDYGEFVFQSIWNNIMPFLSGFFLVKTGNFLFLFLLMIPIYLRFQIKKEDSKKKVRKLYIK